MKRKSVFIIALMLLSFVLSACGGYQFKATTSYDIEDFNVVNHRGEEVSLATFEGKPWLAMFIFTNCTTICSPMTYNMTEIEKILVERGMEDYNIVAFSVDPAVDTPEVLTNYLSRYPGVQDESKWHLLTGYSQEWIEQYAYKNFKSLVKMPTAGDQVLHANTFYLVDPTGVAVKNYSGYSEQEDGVSYETIAIDMETVHANSQK